MSEEEAEQPQPTKGQRPNASFRGSGGLSVGVWKHKSEDGPDYYSISLERSYKNRKGEFEATTSLRDGDLLRMQKLLDQADAWIEQDKSRQRGAGVVQK